MTFFQPVTIASRVFTPSTSSKWRRLKHSYEVLRWRSVGVPYVPRPGDPDSLETFPGGMPRGWNPLYSPGLIGIGLPDVVTVRYGDFMKFSKDWQFFHFDLMKDSTQGSMTEAELRAAFIPIFDRGRFLLNKNSWDSHSSSAFPYHDYINRRYTFSPDPRFEALGMGGNVVRELDRISYGGEWWAVVECLKGSVPPSGYTNKSHPHLVHHAVNETMIEGYPFLTEFPQLKGAPVQFAFASDSGVQWVRDSWLTST